MNTWQKLWLTQTVCFSLISLCWRGRKKQNKNKPLRQQTESRGDRETEEGEKVLSNTNKSASSWNNRKKWHGWLSQACEIVGKPQRPWPLKHSYLVTSFNTFTRDEQTSWRRGGKGFREENNTCTPGRGLGCGGAGGAGAGGGGVLQRLDFNTWLNLYCVTS